MWNFMKILSELRNFSIGSLGTPVERSEAEKAIEDMGPLYLRINIEESSKASAARCPALSREGYGCELNEPIGFHYAKGVYFEAGKPCFTKNNKSLKYGYEY
jgi:hypothetical protein